MRRLRTRGALLFSAGFVAGALVFYSIAWRTGGLVPGHWLSRRTREVVTSPGTLGPIPTIPFPTPTLSAAPAGAEPAGISPASVTPVTPGILSGVPASVLAPGGEPRGASGLLPAAALPVPAIAPLLLPVRGAHVAALKDNFNETRGGTRTHEAIDILAPRGTPVIAAVDGKIAKLFTSQLGGLTVYQFDRDGKYCYYYAHLDRYAPGLAEGATLSRGDRIGDVGTTGNAPKDTPHLHFAIFRLGSDRHWWQGEPVNPYPLLQRSEER